MYTVYIMPDADGRILDITSDAFLTDPTGWRPVASGSGDRYHHAQGNFLPEDVCREGICCWMTAPALPEREALLYYEYEGETWGVYRRTQAETDADRTEAQMPEDLGARVTRLEQQTGEMEQVLDMLLTGVTADE